MKWILLLCLCLFSFVARADFVQVKVSRQDCLRLVVPSADYVAGVSVTGQAVAPADIVDGQVFQGFPDMANMTFPVYLDLKKDFGFLNSEMSLGLLPLATVEIKNGQVFVNGTLVSESGVKSLKKTCSEQLDKEK